MFLYFMLAHLKIYMYVYRQQLQYFQYLSFLCDLSGLFWSVTQEKREIEQNVVLKESSEALENCSEIIRILVLAMTTADDGMGRSNSV